MTGTSEGAKKANKTRHQHNESRNSGNKGSGNQDAHEKRVEAGRKGGEHSHDGGRK